MSLLGDYRLPRASPTNASRSILNLFSICWRLLADFPQGFSCLEVNLLASSWHFAPSPRPPRGRSAPWRDPSWQLQAKRIRPTEPYLTANSRSCCRKPGSSFRVRSLSKRASKSCTLSIRPLSHLHGPRAIAISQRKGRPGSRVEKQRSERVSLGVSWADSLVGGGVRSTLRRWLFGGPLNFSLVVVLTCWIWGA